MVLDRSGAVRVFQRRPCPLWVTILEDRLFPLSLDTKEYLKSVVERWQELVASMCHSPYPFDSSFGKFAKPFPVVIQ
jgi:hypothetical protein